MDCALASVHSGRIRELEIYSKERMRNVTVLRKGMHSADVTMLEHKDACVTSVDWFPHTSAVQLREGRYDTKKGRN